MTKHAEKQFSFLSNEHKAKQNLPIRKKRKKDKDKTKIPLMY